MPRQKSVDIDAMGIIIAFAFWSAAGIGWILMPWPWPRIIITGCLAFLGLGSLLDAARISEVEWQS